MNQNTRDHSENIAVEEGEYRCLFRREIGGEYQIICPEVPSLLAFGETLEEARSSIQEELLRFVDARENDDPHRDLRAASWPRTAK